MANAKSRFVRILALALAVLMVVPMALVGCKKDDGVNKEMLDAAIKEALDAAQAAQDAADKAASDAKDAQDKLDAAQKESDKLKEEADKLKEESDKLKAEADKLKEEVESLKNTTTTKPAPTTTAKVQSDADKKVVDDYVAALLNDSDSELNKLLKKYGYDSKSEAVTSKTFSSVDQKSLAATIADVLLAIQRAHTVDYANQLVASLKTALDAVPTYSERVKEAYDAIDFASDKDVIDVVYAANLVVKALADLSGTDTASKNEVKALKAFGDEKINLIDAIATEYYRYTGNAAKIADASIKDQSEIKVLYKKAYDAVATADIADQIRAIYNVAAGKESDPAALKTANIVWALTLEDAIDAVDDSYKTWKSNFDNAAAKELYAELCIAFAGEDYILTYEGDILNEKLAAAKTRFAQLEAAASEYDKSSFGDKLDKIVTDFKAEGINYLYTNKFTKYGVDYVDGLLSAWMTKYSFSATDKNLKAIIGDKYDTFVAAKKYVNYINDWAVKAANLDVDAIADALAEFADEQTFSYNQYGAVIKSLNTYFAGTKAKNYEDGLLNALYDGAKVYDPANSVEANVDEIIEEVFGKKVTLDNIADICDYLADELADYVAEAKKINDAIAKLDPEKVDFSYLGKIKAIKNDIWDLFDDMDIEPDEVEGTTVISWDLDDINADLVNWEGLETLEAAYDDIRENLMGDAATIVENYIAWKGNVTEDGTIKLTIDGKDYEIEAEPYVIGLGSYAQIDAMKAIYDTLLDAIESGVADSVTLDFVTVDDVLEDEFTLANVVDFFRQMSDIYNRVIIKSANQGYTYSEFTGSIFKDGGLGTRGGTAAINPWAPTDVADAASSTKLTEWAKTYGITYVYVKKGTSPSNKTDGSKVDVYNTVPNSGSGTYLAAVESVNPDQFATWAGEDLDRRLDSFDYKSYGAAVKAAVASKFTTWYNAFLKAPTKANNSVLTAHYIFDAIKYTLAFGLWNIADEFEMDDEKYTFKVLPIDYSKVKIDAYDSIGEIRKWAPTFVIYNEDDEVVADNKITVDGIEYTITLEVGDEIKINATTAAIEELPQVTIYANYQVTEDVAGVPTLVDKKVTLAELLDAEDEYVYTLEGALDEIFANVSAMGTLKVHYQTSAATPISRSNYDKFVDAYNQHVFYTIQQTVWNIMNTYKSKVPYSSNSDPNYAKNKAVEILATEYGVKYKSVNYGAMSIEDLYKGLNRFIGEAEAIIANTK